MSLLLWVLTSLIAISLVGDYPYLALAVAGLAGIAFALNAYSNSENHKRADALALPVVGNRARFLIAQYGWILDLAAAAILIFAIRWMLLGLVLLPISWLLRWWASRRITQPTIFNLPILALALMVPVSLWASADVTQSLVPLGQIIAGINAFCVIAHRVQTERDLHWAVAGLVALGILLALISPFSVDWLKPKLFAVPQIYSRFNKLLPDSFQPNVMAGALAPIIILTLSILLNTSLESIPPRARRLGRLTLVVGLGIMAVILVLTQSRGGLTATFGGILVLVMLSRPRLTVPIAALLVVIAAIVFNQLGVTRVAELVSSTDSISNLAMREEVWSRAVYMLQDVPYTGIGLGIFSRAIPVLYPLFLGGPDASVNHAHNLYLQVGVDLGIPGLIAFLALLVLGLLVSWQAFRATRKTHTEDRAATALGLCIGLLVIMAHGIVDAVTWDTKSSILIWVILAMIAAMDRMPPAVESIAQRG